jgi:hypothetical protein
MVKPLNPIKAQFIIGFSCGELTYHNILHLIFAYTYRICLANNFNIFDYALGSSKNWFIQIRQFQTRQGYAQNFTDN